MHWSAQYVGLPWKEKGRDREGVDCYGPTFLVYRVELGIDLPSYIEDYVSDEESAEVAALLGQAGQSPWHPIPLGQERDFDIAIFRRGGIDQHMGLVTGPGEMLHVCRGSRTYIQRFQRQWRRPAIYRHAALMDGAHG